MHCDLLLDLSFALRDAGGIERSREVAKEAVGLAEQLDDPLRGARAAILATWMLEPGIVQEEAISLLERAALKMPAEDSALHVELLSHLTFVMQLSLTGNTIERATPVIELDTRSSIVA